MAQAVEQVVNNLFKKVNSGPLPPGFLAKGDFYDYKNQLYFSVNIELGSTNNLKVTSYNIYIDTLVSSSVVKQINLLHQLNNSGDLNKNIDDFIIFSSTPRPNYLEYNFSNGTQYEIKHCIEVKDLTPSTPVVYKLEHSQLFTYHDPSVTLSDFTFDDNVSYGDTLKISNLVLVNSDGTSPTNISFEFQEAEHTNDGTEPNEYFSYDLPYNPGGLYDIPNVQLTLGKVYKVQATASWVLGYTTFRRSTKNLYIYERPTITNVEILPLSYKEASEDVIKITMGALSASGSTNPPSKLWFEFYNSNDTRVARAGGDPAANPVTGITASSNNIYLLKLSDIPIISGVGLLNDTSYYVKAVVRYEGYSSLPTATQFRLSDKSSTINFVKKVPVISNRTIHPLYTSTDNTILTIDVDNARYELYAPGSAPSSAPSSVSGIKFYFYDESNLATSVASTSSYQFVNNGTNSSSNTYPILFSEITGTLVNNKDYRIRAEVQLVKHNGDAEQRLSVLSDATSSPDRVNFAEVSPEILSNTINPLYTIDDPSVKKILDIEVKKQAYELYVPNAIKFYFYDHSVSSTNAAASTKSYSFVNSSADSNYSYPILFTDVTTGSLVNNKDYRIEAEVTFADNQTRPSVLSDATSPPDKVNFAYVKPVISSITAYDAQDDGGNDGVGDDSTSQVIASVYVNKEAYQLFAPNIAGAILFIFYDSSDVEVATNPYNFSNSAPGSGSATSLYNIQLNHIPSNSLKNGITYKVKAKVSLGSGSSAEERLSSSFYENVIFSQNVAPVPSVNISNTWALVTANDPSSSPTRFNNSPLIGISGYFSKTAQFGSNYSNKHLDVDSTKFELEYKVDGGAWVYVKNAKLVLQGSEGAETLEEAADRARDASIITSSVGRYDNIPGSGDGTTQGYIVFYIPQQQEITGNAFTESNKVRVRVTIIDTATLWGNSSNTRATTESSSVNPLQLINKINTYNYVAGAYTEPWNSVDSSSGKLLMNIPVAWNSIHADSVKVGVKYSSDGSYSYQTINYSSSLAHVSIIVEPTDGTMLYYSVAYIVKNVNLGSTTQGLIDEKNVDNKKFPVSSDYVISNLSYKTINSDNKSSVLFNLVINADSTSRIDGVNVYFTSPISIGTNPISNSSNIPKIRIGSSKISVTGKEITLTDDTALKTMNASGVIVTTSGYNWQHYDLAYISFEAFRDARVVSATATYNSSSDVYNPVSSNYYVESGGSPAPTTTLTQDVNRVWNVPKLTKPSADASGTNIYELSGGVLNIVEGSNYHVIKWPTASNLNSVPFTYDLTITRNEDTTPSVVDDTNLTGNSCVIPNVNGLDKYTIQVKKVFNGSLTKREISDPDTIVFYTAKVDTSAMVVSVQNPSNSSSVTLSWNSPVFTGLSVTGGEPDSAQFSHNVHTHYIQYRTGGSGNYSRLGPSSDPIIENSSPKTYTLPDTNLGTLYDFVMYVKAQVKFTLNGVVHSSKSLPFQVPLTSVTTASQYRVSTIPSIGLPSNTPVLISGEANPNPTLLLDLNAKGLEDEGFISVVVILTQDGTTNKPEGEQVLLVFPGSSSSSFNFTNVLQGSGSGGADARLVGGESATSGPFEVTNSSVSTHNNNYTLKIGTTKPDGRYGYSTLSMPSSINSGFVNSGLSSSADYNPINYMVILTTRRGTDIKVGDFVYQSIPAVQNVTITTSNGQYFVNFDINNI